MGESTNSNILNNTDEAVLKAIILCDGSPIDWKELIHNIFFFEKYVIWYKLLNESLRRLVASNFLNFIDGQISINYDLTKEYYAIVEGTHAEFTESEKLLLKYPINEGILETLPKRIISVEMFEAAMARFYDFINRYMPEKLAPRLIAENMLLIEGTSTDETYGYTVGNPINVGGIAKSGTAYINMFFNSIVSEAGNAITYQRIGTCLEVEAPAGRSEDSIVDFYAAIIEEEDKVIYLHLNMYDCTLPLKAPIGFKGKGDLGKVN